MTVTELTASITRLESIKKKYKLLLIPRDSVPAEEKNFLEERGYENLASLDTAIQEKKHLLDQCVKNKQIYYFSKRLDASIANNALIYIKPCEKVDHTDVKQKAIEAHESLQNYINEYGNFLHQEIRKKFTYTITCVDIQEDPFLPAYDLKMYLEELSSISKFTHVLEYLNEVDKIEYWHREFLDYHHMLSCKLEECKTFGGGEELTEKLTIAQVLSGLDRFCETIFGSHGFKALYGQY